MPLYTEPVIKRILKSKETTHMYTIDDEHVNDLAESFRNIVRSAEALLKDPTDNQHRLEQIVTVAKLQLKHIKDGSYTTKPSQRIQKPRIG